MVKFIQSPGMKKLISSLILSGIAIITYAQPPAGNAHVGENYGAIITVENAINSNELPALLTKSGAAVDTKVKAKILDVCPKKGCWLKVAIDDNTTALVKMKDYGFFLPVAAIGKTVVIDGKAELKTISVEELKHYAEDAKKSKEEIAKITKPSKEINLMANGIIVVED